MNATYPSCDGQDSRPLLYRLKRSSHCGSSAQVQRATLLSAQEDVDVVVPLVLGVLDDSVKLLEFDCELFSFQRLIASEFCQDLDRFFAAMVGDKPTRRFWQEGHSEEDYDHWNHHRQQRHPPSKFVAVVSGAEDEPISNDCRHR